MGDEQAGRRSRAGDDDEGRGEALLVPSAVGGRVDETEEADDLASIDLEFEGDDGDDLDRLGGFDDFAEMEEGIATSALRRVVDGVLDRVLTGMDVRRVFGEPLTRGEVTVVPVAEVRSGFGFGGGGGEGEEGEGGGAGGAGSVGARPIGFLEVTAGGARFVPITDTGRLAVVGAVVGGAAALMLLRRLLR